MAPARLADRLDERLDRLSGGQRHYLALWAVLQAPADLVLLDVVMPGLGGFEVCARLRALDAGLLVPIIMLTGLDDSESVQRAFDAGATDFISKPINWTLLRFRVRYVLRSADVMKELVRNKESLSNAQRVARLGSWEWWPERGDVRRSEQYFRLFGQTAASFGDDAQALVDHVYLPDRATVAAALDEPLAELETMFTPCIPKLTVAMPVGGSDTCISPMRQPRKVSATSISG